MYTHPRVGEETNRNEPPELGLTPSATVTLKPKTKTADSLYFFRQEANTVVKHDATISDRFNSIHYVSLLRKEFGTIEIDIRDDTGRRVPFEYGRVTVTLHFRRRRTGLF